MEVEEPLKELAKCWMEDQRKFKFIKARWSKRFGFLITVCCENPCTEKGLVV